MDRQISVDRDVLVDLESGMNTMINQQEEAKDVGCGAGQGRRVLDKEWSGFLGIDGFMKHEEAVKLENGMPGCAELPIRNAEASVDKRDGGEEWVRLLEEKVGAEKMKKKGCKKHPKPPRPPRSPSLDAADQKLIREISELSMMKRARIEQMKKKMRNTKSTSSTGNFFALIVTILFCLVIIWQEAFSQRSSIVRSHGSESSVRGGLISVHFHKNASVNHLNMSSSGYPSNL
ncbi:uncharacterized protein LOC103993319 isoform X1 [Musa acuminata AAA Group]|uniref:(wild Malaysian banana) hypothetical protein n=1 Tax=Musa acuminata subsp. malaccensis TaxID=214687 RepID=A0A804K540_MUSAM|nr:PREDICTED: uncharacterized protein LOC103993319 isoform X1 [Musa acuminata subsp. malaccensis]CAG1831153.1 unnamed protein product [Musa acuminata subsp. malaccensis]